MIIFNTTFHVDESVKDEFVEYMLQKFIPASTKSGILTAARLSQVFGARKEEGVSYALEFATKDILALEKWNKEESGMIYKSLLETFKDKVVGFSTVMQTINY